MKLGSRVAVWVSLVAVCFVFGVFYARGASRPLREDYDTAEYFKMADALHEGHLVQFSWWPVGYPILIEALRDCGQGSALLWCNLLFLATGLALFWIVAVRFHGLSHIECAALCTWTVASRITLNLATVAQPEMCFLATSMGCVLCLSMALQSNSPYWLLPALMLTVCSVALRTVGISLYPAVLFTAHKIFSSRPAAHRAAADILVLAALGFASILLVDFKGYGNECAGTVYRAMGVVNGLLTTMDLRWEETTELFCNLGYFAGWPTEVRPALFSFSLAVIGAGLAGIYRARSSPLAIYFASYVAILIVYPFYMPRFWASVAPLAAFFVWTGCKWIASRFSWPRYSRELAVLVYLAAFFERGLSIARL
jgi:hypothetical protein